MKSKHQKHTVQRKYRNYYSLPSLPKYCILEQPCSRHHHPNIPHPLFLCLGCTSMQGPFPDRWHHTETSEKAISGLLDMSENGGKQNRGTWRDTCRPAAEKEFGTRNNTERVKGCWCRPVQSCKLNLSKK